ncbi:hypothetical protein DFH29DRAFT_363617 [Suillus ampliporus]|nr:hypothetical protein DFH29DRAFT_363617 [Suillus ampliporus]
MLLAHPAINVNVLDKESHWTPLHRALYAGNVCAAISLLKRPDIDISVKDLEGYTTYDLYDSTVRFAKPPADEEALAEWFAWGRNRFSQLGYVIEVSSPSNTTSLLSRSHHGKSAPRGNCLSRVLQRARLLLIVGPVRNYGRGALTAGNLVGRYSHSSHKSLASFLKSAEKREPLSSESCLILMSFAIDVVFRLAIPFQVSSSSSSSKQPHLIAHKDSSLRHTGRRLSVLYMQHCPP